MIERLKVLGATGGVTLALWGTTMYGSGPAYYYPPHYVGGPEAFAAGNKWWQDRGGIVGYYLHPNGQNPYFYYKDNKKYFDTPWEKIPDYGRPPGWNQGKAWDWLVKNAAYDRKRPPPEPDPKKWAELIERKTARSRGRYPRYPAFMPAFTYVNMSPLSEEHMAWFKSWVVDKYIGKFHTGAAYLDTFHIRAEVPEFNPHLGFHGEGHGGYRRHKFAKEIKEAALKLNPDYLPIMEMNCDVYGIYLAYQSGSSSIDSEMLRYTHPDHMFFEGQSGRGWDEKRFKRFNSCWMYGNRLDHRLYEPWAVAVIRMRNWITRWINASRFIDDLGLKIENPEIHGKLHRVMTEDGSRGFLANFWNTARVEHHPGNKRITSRKWPPTRVSIDLTPMAAVDDTGTKAEDWLPKRALLIDMNRAPRPIPFDVVYRQGRPHIEFLLPQRQTNGALFVREAKGELGFLARADQKDFRQLDVHLVNPGNATIEGSVKVSAETLKFPVSTGTFTVKPGERTVVSFPYPDGKPPNITELVEVKISSGGAERNIRTAAYPFLDDASFENDHIHTYSTVAAHGRRSRRLSNHETVRLVLEPATKYRLSFQVRGEKKGGKATLFWGKQRRRGSRADGVMLLFYHPIVFAADKWQKTEFTLQTPDLYHDTWFSFRIGGGASLLIDDVRLETLGDDAEVQYQPEYRETD